MRVPHAEPCRCRPCRDRIFMRLIDVSEDPMAKLALALASIKDTDPYGTVLVEVPSDEVWVLVVSDLTGPDDAVFGPFGSQWAAVEHSRTIVTDPDEWDTADEEGIFRTIQMTWVYPPTKEGA